MNNTEAVRVAMEIIVEENRGRRRLKKR